MQRRETSCFVERIAYGDDGDVDEIEVDVTYDTFPAEPDVGIMEPYYEIVSVAKDGSLFSVTPDEENLLYEQLWKDQD